MEQPTESSDWAVLEQPLQSLWHRQERKSSPLTEAEEKIKNIRRYTDYAFVAENLSMETLKEIGIQNCDVAIICIGEKVDVSILTTMSAIELGDATRYRKSNQ